MKTYVECFKTYFEVLIPLFSPWIFLSPSLDTTGITPFLKSSKCCKLSQTYFQLSNKNKFWFYNLKLILSFENFFWTFWNLFSSSETFSFSWYLLQSITGHHRDNTLSKKALMSKKILKNKFLKLILGF